MRRQGMRRQRIFQLTTSRRGRHYLLYWKSLLFSFNSRPHAEVDLHVVHVLAVGLLSTHDLTQRSTIVPVEGLSTPHLSTHDLTQRSTSFLTAYLTSFQLSTHDLTQRSTHQVMRCRFADIFQLTTSRRGRRASLPASTV